MSDRSLRIVEWIGFQVVWLASAIGAAHGRTAPALVAAAIFVSAVLARRRWRAHEVAMVLISGAAGAIIETLLIATGFIRFSEVWPSPEFAPAWIIALWLAFGATLSTMALWIGDRFAWKAGIVGFLGGPLAYWAGVRFGALAIAEPSIPFYAVSGAIWAVALPALLAVNSRLKSDVE